jgi:hypothetical protein
MWNFAELYAHLINVAERNFTSSEKILFAREFELDQWIIPAHIQLCRRHSPLNSEEAEHIGLSSLLFISRIREEKLKIPGGVMPDSEIQAIANAWIKNGCVFDSYLEIPESSPGMTSVEPIVE